MDTIQSLVGRKQNLSDWCRLLWMTYNSSQLDVYLTPARHDLHSIASFSRWFLQQTLPAGDFCATCVLQFAANANPFQDQHEDLDDLAVAERELP